jgi:hypothetical protein
MQPQLLANMHLNVVVHLLDGWLVRRHDGPEYSVFFVLVRQPIPQACHF